MALVIIQSRNSLVIKTQYLPKIQFPDILDLLNIQGSPNNQSFLDIHHFPRILRCWWSSLLLRYYIKVFELHFHLCLSMLLRLGNYMNNLGSGHYSIAVGIDQSFVPNIDRWIDFLLFVVDFLVHCNHLSINYLTSYSVAGYNYFVLIIDKTNPVGCSLMVNSRLILYCYQHSDWH